MISILMPIYNGIEFIDESVSSIMQQTYTEWELIIGVNGHPPNSEVFQKAKVKVFFAGHLWTHQKCTAEKIPYMQPGSVTLNPFWFWRFW